MNQHPSQNISAQQYVQKHSYLLKQLKQCYLFDRYPQKKQLDKAFRLIGQLKKSKVPETTLISQISSILKCCEDKVKLSIGKVEQRKSALPQPKFPNELPVSRKLKEIQRLLLKHQVVIVAGETGSGKTTQLPKIALTIGRGVMGQIAHTQPRRLAARSVAERIAQELQTPLGEKVGFKVRFSDKSRDETYVKLMTDGILLAETQADRLLNRYDTIIIDEAHERSLNIDFLLGYIKQLLPRRPDLKVIITSATIDTGRFSQFFNNAPVIEVSGRTYPVEIRYRSLEDDNAGLGKSLQLNKGLQPNKDPQPNKSTKPDKSSQADPMPVKGDMVEGILAAVDELALETEGDILIFLSGEREIRESAEALRKHHSLFHGHQVPMEILPLYARLSPAEQSRIFSAHQGRRIILATNVAETSLTVPGIRYVIDTGFARISRYSVRHKIQRLPIEKVSQASARQRSGRCGRVSDGIAIRLYSESDHEQRPGFTEPELLRTSLAQVILQMLSLKLGDIKAFPFIEDPSAKQINDGYLLLEQLGAINCSRKLTAIGRSLAKLSVDPKIARVIIAAQQQNVLSEVLIIASGLSCQDPRERPSDKQQAADEKHAQYTSKRSDFISYLNLWVSYEAQRKHLTQNKLRKYCKAHFLSFMRMREWRELYQQLYTQTRELGFRYNELPSLNTERPSDDEDKLDYVSIHQALLTGFLGNIGYKEEKNVYLGARNMRFSIFPGSRLYKRKPKWIMAAEIVETSAVYARIVAAIEPLWLEQQAQHLLKHHYYEPFWEEKSGQVSAWSRVSLYGLIINARKKVNYGPIDPEVSQKIFIRDALVTGEYKDQNRNTPGFIKNNLALINELEHLEHKSRRKDLLVDDLAIFEFYQQRIEHEWVLSNSHQKTFIYTRAAFEQWRKKVEKKDPDHLQLEQSDLLKKEVDHVSDELYPPILANHDLQLPLEYHFLPGHELDGVTLVFPLPVINQLDEALFDWLVPGMIREKITLLLRALPKVIRKQFVPIPDTVTAFLEHEQYRNGYLIEQLLKFLKSRLSYTLSNQLEHEMGKDAHADFSDKIPEHLKMNFKIIDKEGHELDSNRNLSILKQRWGERALEQLEQTTDGLGQYDNSIERQDILSWDFNPLPEQLIIERHGMTMTLYPALQDKGDSVAIKLYDQKTTANDNHGQGIYRLLKLLLTKELKILLKQLPYIDKACLLFTSYGSCSDLKQDIVNGLLLNCINDTLDKDVMNISQIRNKEAFEHLFSSVMIRLDQNKADVCQTVLNVLQANHLLAKQLKGNIPFSLVSTLADIKAQQSQLVFKNFIAQTPLIWLKRLPRYFKGMTSRLDKAKSDHRRDGLNQMQIIPLWEKYEVQKKTLKKDQNTPEVLFFARTQLEEFRWLIEELRISLFAQELKTAQPVSVKRLEKKWKEICSD